MTPELDLYFGCIRRILDDGRHAYIEVMYGDKGRMCVGKIDDMGYDHAY